MKLKLSIGQTDFVGYKNANPFASDFKEIYDNSCMEIYCCEEVLSKVRNKDFDTFLDSILKKLRIGGEITFSSPDISDLNYAYVYRKIDENILSQLIGGHLGLYNCKLIENALRSKGLKIEQMSIQNYFFCIKASR